MAKRKIAVTGANGQLGKALEHISGVYPQYEYVFLSREDLPLDDADRMRSFFSGHRFDYCINCAAYTAVDKAESEKEKAFLINGEAPGIIGSILAAQGGTLIQLSTDYVFDGNSAHPLTEDEPVNPVNIYGASKLLGEMNALGFNPKTLVLRTSWLYSAYGHNFVKTMIRLMGEKESISVVNDQLGSPTYAADLAEAIMQIVGSGDITAGIYHYSNEGTATWYEFAKAIKKQIGSACTVNPVSSANYPTSAKRPKFSLLDKSKIKRVYGISIPVWEQSLAKCIDLLKKNQV